MKTIAIGLIIALMGIAVLSQYGVASTHVREMAIATSPPNGETEPNDSWTISANLTEADTVKYFFQEGYNWTEGRFDIGDDGVSPTLWVNVGITPVNPTGNTTIFTVELHLVQPSSTNGYSASRLLWYNNSVLQEGSIDTSVVGRDSKGRYLYVGGRIPWNGTYQADLAVYPPQEVPPNYLGFYHNITVTSHPYSDLLPVGGVITASGGALSAFGVRWTMSHSAGKPKKIKKQSA